MEESITINNEHEYFVKEISEYHEKKHARTGEIKELYGIIAMINLEIERTKENDIILSLPIDVFKVDGNKIYTNRFVCKILGSTMKFIDNDGEHDWLTGLLSYNCIGGLEGYVGKLVKIKGYDETVKEIEFISSDTHIGKLICDTVEDNAYDNFNGVFYGVNPYEVLVVTSVDRKYSTIGSCYISEFPPITANEIKNIVGPSMEGKFDKTIYEWHIQFDIEYPSNIESKIPQVGSFLYTVYDYKNYDGLGEDERDNFHIGCGWHVGGEKFNQDDILNLFRFYMYNKIIEQRTNKN